MKWTKKEKVLQIVFVFEKEKNKTCKGRAQLGLQTELGGMKHYILGGSGGVGPLAHPGQFWKTIFVLQQSDLCQCVLLKCAGTDVKYKAISSQFIWTTSCACNQSTLLPSFSRRVWCVVPFVHSRLWIRSLSLTIGTPLDIVCLHHPGCSRVNANFSD